MTQLSDFLPDQNFCLDFNSIVTTSIYNEIGNWIIAMIVAILSNYYDYIWQIISNAPNNDYKIRTLC